MKGFVRTVLSVITLTLVLFGTQVQSVRAQLTFEVDNTADDADFNAGDGICSTSPPNGINDCTLRAAIEEANATAVRDTIYFNIPGTDPGCSGGICTIMPDSVLPDITEETILDATTQPGASCLNKTLKVVLDGTNAGASSSGLTIYTNDGSDSYVAGLVVHSFGRHGIEISYSSRNIVSCNIVGLDVDGETQRGNWDFAAAVRQEFGNNNIIGVHSDDATDTSEGNVLSGDYLGVYQFGGSGNRISGNIIGGNVALTDTVANRRAGVGIQCGVGTIVGTNFDGMADFQEGNIIVGNERGVHVQCGSPASMDYEINRNFIGTTPGSANFGNRTYGILIEQANGNTTDGISDRNYISNNGEGGIGVGTTSALLRHRFTRNAFTGNGGLGIDIGFDGVSLNDPSDSDDGPNQLQNTPVFTEIRIHDAAAELEVSYWVDSDPANSAFPVIVEVFTAYPGGNEGYLFIGADTLTAAEYSGCGTPPCVKTVTFGSTSAYPGDRFVATATDANGNTSEFPQAGVAVNEVFTVGAGAILEGPWLGPDGVAMSTALQSGGHLPYYQPFSDPMFDSTPLAFDSLQSATLPSTAVDWVLVSLRTGPEAAMEVPGTKHAAWIDHNGTIRTPGADSLMFAGVAGGAYYLVLQARNHLGVMTSSTMPYTDQIASWYFWSGSGQAYGTNPMKDVFSGLTWALLAADGNADGFVTAPDFNLWNAATTAGATGYEPSDYNLDGNVTAPDFNLWNANTTAGASSQVPE